MYVWSFDFDKSQIKDEKSNIGDVVDHQLFDLWWILLCSPAVAAVCWLGLSPVATVDRTLNLGVRDCSGPDET